MNRKLAMLMALVLTVSLLAACGGGDTPAAGNENTPADSGDAPSGTAPAASGGNQTAVIHLLGDPATMQPNTVTDDFNWPAVQNIYNRLVKLDASKSIIPDLARSWDNNEDGTVITFHLAENVKWHDGEPFSSEDVKYTLDYLRTNEACFANPLLQTIADIECPDENTVVLNMNEPDAGIIGYLGWIGTFIMPKHLFDTGESWDDNPVSQTPVGTGPFKFVSYTPASSIELEKNPDYWEAEPILDRLIYSIIPEPTTAVQALRTGEIDLMEVAPNSDVPSLEAEGFRVESNVYPSPMYLLFNWREGYQTAPEVREAIAMCISREDINNKVFANARTPEYNFYPSMVAWATNNDAPAPSYSIEAAVQLLEDAGYEKDSDGYYIRGLAIECYTVDNAADVAKLISASCKDAGIEVAVNSQEYLAWDQTVNPLKGSPGDFSIVLMGGFQGPDPAALQNRVGTDGTSNLGAYTNSEVDQLFAEAKTSLDQDYRAERYRRIQEILSQELPIIPIVAYAEYNAWAPNLKDVPLENAGKSGWAEYTFTYFE